MNSIKKQLEVQLSEINAMIQQTEAHLKTIRNIPSVHLRITSSNHKTQYILVDKTTGNETYLPTSQTDKARSVAQYDYETRLLKTLIKNRRTLSLFLKSYDEGAAENIYENMCEGRKALITPAILPNKSYIDQWLKQHPGDMNPFDEKGMYPTDHGDNVRSKSEKILADLFYRSGIPYSYEPRLKLKNGRCVYPDFALLNVRTRTTFYWEHLGLISDEKYAAKNTEKILQYEESGIIAGINLIITAESNDHPLDLTLVRKKIEIFLK